MIKNFLVLMICNIFALTNLYAEEAVFAMGCFWCGEAEFRDHATNKPLPGITAVEVGYAGGTIPNPTYGNHKGYVEAIKIVYDPKKIAYPQLLEIFWHNIDPFDERGQFCDKGASYVAVIYYTNKAQETEALRTRQKYEQELNREFVTQILPFTTFYPAEEYHQNYAHKNPVKYKFYRWNCGRDRRLKSIWE